MLTFMAMSFIAGFVLVTAAQRNTEERSKASGFVYTPTPIVVDLTPKTCPSGTFLNQQSGNCENVDMAQQIKDWIAAGKKIFDQGAINKGADIECKSGTKVSGGGFTWCE